MGHVRCAWLFALFLLVAVSGEPESFDKHKLIRAVPKDKDQLAFLDNILKTREDVDFWSYPYAVGQNVDMNLSPAVINEVTGMLDEENIPYTVALDSVGRMLLDEQTSARAGSFDDQYHRLGEIHSELQRFASQHSDIASVFSMGKSYENRDQLAIKIGSGSKNLFFFNCGIHAREWISPATCMFMIRQMLEKRNNDRDVQFMLRSYQWIILPVLNVDGYEYTHTRNRMWRKTRTPQSGGCYGADPNRNWNFRWAGVGTSSRECSDIFTGSRPFSEKVTHNVAKFLYSNRRRLKGYIDFHSYSQLWLSPWGYETGYPPRYTEMKKAMQAAVNALRSVHGTSYTLGPAATTIYPTTGDTTDWTFGVLGVTHSYCVELRPRTSGEGGFSLPPRYIKPTGEETFAGLKALVKNM